MVEFRTGFFSKSILCHVFASELACGGRIPLQVVEIIAIQPGNIQPDADTFLMLQYIFNANPGKCVPQVLYIFSEPCFCKMTCRFIRPKTANQCIVGTDRTIVVDQAGKKFFAFGIGEVKRNSVVVYLKSSKTANAKACSCVLFLLAVMK